MLDLRPMFAEVGSRAGRIGGAVLLVAAVLVQLAVCGGTGATASA